MKKKRFNNKKRNTKWTEPVKGRKISFADKYIDAGTGSDKFDRKRPKQRKKIITKQKLESVAKALIICVCCFVVISIGYMTMDLYMDRRSMPSGDRIIGNEALLKDVQYDVRGIFVQPLSIDGGVMLSTIIDDAQQQGYNAVAFDVKRDDGTIGYESKLATIGAYGAVSSAATNLDESVSLMKKNDILPIARISCLKDNIIPAIDMNAAIMDGQRLYRDDDGNTYLNPNNELAYDYLYNIIEELRDAGFTVFLLDNYILPEDISDEFSDGYDEISKRIYAKFNGEIKLLAAENVSIKSKGDDELAQELNDKVIKNNNPNKIYFISAKKPEAVKKLLEENRITNFIIEQ